MDAHIEEFNKQFQERLKVELEDIGSHAEDSFQTDESIAAFNKEFVFGSSRDDADDDANEIAVFNMTAMRNSLPPPSLIHVPPSPILSVEDTTAKLKKIDEDRHAFVENINKILPALETSQRILDGLAVVSHRNKLSKNVKELKALRLETSTIDVGQDKTNILFREDLLANMASTISKAEKACTIGGHSVDVPKLVVHSGANFVNTDDLAVVRMRRMHYMTLVPMLLVIVLSVLGHLSNPFANSSLRILIHYISLVLRGPSEAPLDLATIRLINAIPRDVRTVKKRLRLSPVFHTFAVCPKCAHMHEPETLPDGKLDFPRRCTYRKGKKKILCNTTITKDATLDGEVRRVPIKPYTIQDFNSFKARFLMDPVIEGLVYRGQRGEERETMEDIKHGKRWRSVPGPNGGIFMDPNSDELRLAWNLSVDWANPFSNKAAGKQASVGSVAATCLNLPPLYRYRMENIYLASVLPGPQEPSMIQVIGYLDVIVDMFLQSYLHGTHFSSTYLHPEGVLERSIILALVSDQPAARKCGGMATSASPKNMCNLCHMTMGEINELDMSKPCWKSRTYEEFVRDATLWRDTPGVGDQESLFTQNGVRWSPFLRLPYWDPHKSIVVDGMHNLLLGLIQYHCRLLLGIDAKSTDDKLEKQLTPAKANEARVHFKTGKVSMNYIKKLSIPDLQRFCREWKVDTSAFDEGPLLQRQLRGALHRAVNDTDVTKAVPLQPKENPEANLSGSESSSDEDEDSEFVDANPSRKRNVPKLTKPEIKLVQESIQKTQRPRWHKGPPSNLGEKEHGKLKADQWRSSIEFDVPVALAKLSKRNEGSVGHAKLFRSTMLLAIAIRYATSHKTSEHHIQRYTETMLEYLKSILDIAPATKFRSNHHLALHLGDYLRLYGPIHGWWMFVFERVIGKLQQANTNNRMGELEKTMLDNFASAGNLKAVLKHPDAGELISTISNMLESGEVDRGSLFVDGLAGTEAGTNSQLSKAKDVGKVSTLESVIYDAFTKVEPFVRREYSLPGWEAPKSATVHSHIKIRGYSYSSSSKSSSKFIFCKSGKGELWPSDIHQIISVPSPKQNEPLFFLVLRSYTRASKIEDPFRTPDFKDFGASLWGKQTLSQPFVLPVHSAFGICHGIKAPWDEHHIVTKPLHRDF